MTHDHSGERHIQRAMESTDRADKFYQRQMVSSLNQTMIELIERQEMVFLATSDAQGNCDCSPRFGKAGFVHVIDRETLAYPEFRGNGVYASLGNMLENPRVGLVFLDFFETTVGLHVNGRAESFTSNQIPDEIAEHLSQIDSEYQHIVERWVVVRIDEAYIHCSKHVPLLRKLDKSIDWGTDDPTAKSTDFFR